jgi:hypothetical protein
MSVSSSIRWAGTPRERATSTNRFEFELLRDPITSRRSIYARIALTARWRLLVA